MNIYQLSDDYKNATLLAHTNKPQPLEIERVISLLDQYYRIRSLDTECSFLVTTRGMMICDLFLVQEGDTYRIRMKAEDILPYFWGQRDFEGILNLHNHPSGWCRESKRDVSFNEELRNAVHTQLNKKYLGGYIVTAEEHIRIHDHLYQYRPVSIDDYLQWQKQSPNR